MSIFDRVRAVLQRRPPLARNSQGDPANLELEVATVVLLLDVAYEDHEFLGTERATILLAVEREFGIGEAQALELIESAERLRRDSAHLSSSSARIVESYDREQRKRIAGLLWKVVYADQVVDAAEVDFVNRVMPMLDLEEHEAKEARLSAFSWFSESRSGDPS